MKRIILLFTVLCMVSSLCSCGVTTDRNDKSKKSGKEPEIIETTAQSEEETTAEQFEETENNTNAETEPTDTNPADTTVSAETERATSSETSAIAEKESKVETTVTQVGCKHIFKITETVDAKCMEDGYNKYVCTNCSYSFVEKIPRTGHYYKVDEHPTVSCTKQGKAENVCVYCGIVLKENLPPQGHKYSVSSTSSPNCIEPGYEESKCVRCGDITRKKIPATGHTYDYTTFSKTQHKKYCLNCGESFGENHTFTTDNYGKSVCKFCSYVKDN